MVRRLMLTAWSLVTFLLITLYTLQAYNDKGISFAFIIVAAMFGVGAAAWFLIDLVPYRSWIYDLLIILCGLAMIGITLYGLATGIAIPYGVAVVVLLMGIAAVSFPYFDRREYAEPFSSPSQSIAEPATPVTVPVSTEPQSLPKEAVHPLATEIADSFDVPPSVRGLLNAVADSLLKDAVVMPGEGVEPIKSAVMASFHQFVHTASSFYPFPTQETPLRTAIEHIFPDYRTLSYGVFTPVNDPHFPVIQGQYRDNIDRWAESADRRAQRPCDSMQFTPISHLYRVEVIPYALSEEERYKGMWLPAVAGSGKTTLLNGLIKADLAKVAAGDASIILMDSKSDEHESLIDAWRNVDFAKLDPRLAGKVHIFDPDIDVALNVLDLGDLTQTVELIEYIFSSVLASSATPLQSTLLRSVIILAKATPKPSLAMVRDILTKGWRPFERYVRKLDPEDREFFDNFFDTKTYADTKNQLLWRLKDLSDRAPALRPTLRSTETRVDLRELIDGGNIIVINAKTSLLGDMGSEFWQRLWIAELLRAARLRKNRKSVYFYCDEAHTAIARDTKIAKILDECRSARIATVIAHQGRSQITDTQVTAALERCALKFEYAGKTGVFSLNGMPIRSDLTDMSALPKLTAGQAAALKEEMRSRYGNRRDATDDGMPPHEPPQPFQPKPTGPKKSNRDPTEPE